MDLELEIRKLARSFYWQKLYNLANKGLKLFENETNLSGIQVSFLYWCQVYSMLYKELQEREWEWRLDEKVIENPIRCDAFLYWRGKEIDKKLKEHKQIMKDYDKPSKNRGKGGKNYSIYKGKGK